tara:strand:+ start:383 stop:538 length:156 start_codon:yes stop_codon:yes gene_type:complete
MLVGKAPDVPSQHGTIPDDTIYNFVDSSAILGSGEPVILEPTFDDPIGRTI